jgi:uncharacterized protein YuzE
MKIELNKKAGALYINLIEGAEISESEEIKTDTILDYDKNNNIVGIEMLNIDRNFPIENFLTCDFEINPE